MEIIGLLLLIIIIVVSILLGFWIYLSDKKSAINRWFLSVALSILLWNLFAYFGYSSKDVSVSLLYFRLNFFAVSVYLLCFYFFTNHFPVLGKKKSRITDAVVIIITAIFAIGSLFSDTVIKSVSIPSEGKLIVEMGFLGNVFYLYSMLLTAYILYVLIKKNKSLSNVNRSKNTYFLTGTILYAILNVVFSIAVSFIYPENYNYTQLGDFSAIVFLGFTAYAIVKHQLFNMKIIATETIVVLLSLSLLVQIFLPGSMLEHIVKAVIWLLATYGGLILVRSVKKEIKQKEELELLAKKLEEANTHLKDLDRMKDDFLGMASHELNTPLAAIEGYLSMILEEGMGGNLQPQTREYLDRIFSSSQRLSAIVKDLLNVSRIESGRIHLLYAEVQIEDLIKQAVAEIDPKVKEKRHTTCLELPADPLPKSWMDPTRITEVLLNLLGNAVKYTDDGGHIEIGAKQQEKEVLIWVKDNGKGIPKDRADRVFAKFTQVDVLKDEVKGTGLGMYISQKFVELHKGKIWFESDGPSKGTTFFVSLPFIKEKPYDPNEDSGPVLR